MVIYKFTHIESGRCYIGQTIQQPNRRRLEHISNSRYTPKTYHFHNAIKKYSIDAFTFEVIATATSLEELNLLEEHYVEKFNSIENGFNIRNPGGNKKHNLESIERMRKVRLEAHAKKKELNIPYAVRNLNQQTNKGKPHPNKGGTSKNKGKKLGMSWEEIYGVEGAQKRREQMKLRSFKNKEEINV
jgi:group I intron endonuclease